MYSQCEARLNRPFDIERLKAVNACTYRCGRTRAIEVDEELGLNPTVLESIGGERMSMRAVKSPNGTD